MLVLSARQAGAVASKTLQLCTIQLQSTTRCPSGVRGGDTSSTSASCVGSNPTGVNLFTACNAVIHEWGTTYAQQSYVWQKEARTHNLNVRLMTLGLANLQ